MIILGIDPGIQTIGYGVISQDQSKLKMITYGCIKTDSKLALSKRLKIIHTDLQELISKFSPDLICVEKIFFFKNMKTAIIVSHAIGVILLVIEQNNILLKELTPLQVKQSITGYGLASKNQIQKMIKMILKLKETPKPDDAADALALAVCGASGIKIFSKNKINLSVPRS